MSAATTPVTGVDFVCVPTRDYEKAAEFYGTALGLPFVKRWGDLPAGEFQAGDLTIAVMQTDAFGIEFQAHSVPIALQVRDYKSARAELESRGVAFVSDKIDSGFCSQAMFKDPDGNTLGIHHRYAEN